MREDAPAHKTLPSFSLERYTHNLIKYLVKFALTRRTLTFEVI